MMWPPVDIGRLLHNAPLTRLRALDIGFGDLK
jgi:hypothetical protein